MSVAAETHSNRMVLMIDQNDKILYRTILNAIPTPVFVVDDDVRVADLNEVAHSFAGQERVALLKRRGGEVLHCLHSKDAPGGCGRGESCQQCVIRNSVKLCFKGKTVTRARMKMDFLPESGRKTMEMLITASPMRDADELLALLIIEDITEISTLKNIIPICLKCKKIRNDEQYWQSVEQYFNEHIGVDFSHGLCPACADQFYPELRRNRPDAD